MTRVGRIPFFMAPSAFTASMAVTAKDGTSGFVTDSAIMSGELSIRLENIYPDRQIGPSSRFSGDRPSELRP